MQTTLNPKLKPYRAHSRMPHREAFQKEFKRLIKARYGLDCCYQWEPFSILARQAHQTHYSVLTQYRAGEEQGRSVEFNGILVTDTPNAFHYYIDLEVQSPDQALNALRIYMSLLIRSYMFHLQDGVSIVAALLTGYAVSLNQNSILLVMFFVASLIWFCVSVFSAVGRIISIRKCNSLIKTISGEIIEYSQKRDEGVITDSKIFYFRNTFQTKKLTF